MTDPFKRLGLKQASATEAEVKAAYAALLKTTRPEEDREAFMELRAAFSQARTIAKANDQARAAQPDPDQAAAQTADPAPPLQPTKWSYHKNIDWNIPDTPLGQLIKDTLEWMIGGGQNAETFVQQVAERLVSEAQISEAEFHADLIQFIFVRSDPSNAHRNTESWRTVDLTRPDWLNDDLMHALEQGLRLFKTRPSQSYAARNYNSVLKLFQPVLTRTDTPTALDAADLFAKEETVRRQDAHGSYFDRTDMAWKDMSPLASAMRDIRDATDAAVWDLSERIEAVLNRENLQGIDEFQSLEAALRMFVCSATGFDTQTRELTYPTWLSKKVMLLLEDRFGWSRQHGRNAWERRQFDWLHKVIARDRYIKSDTPQFRPPPLKAQRPPPAKAPDPFLVLIAQLYFKPVWLLVGYFGYRVVQIFFRLAT